jgi:hypothetical protein
VKGKKENAPKKITQHEILLMKEEKLNSANLEKNLRPNFGTFFILFMKKIY